MITEMRAAIFDLDGVIVDTAKYHYLAWRKLAILGVAESLGDLRIPPGNWLEKLTGKRLGQYSIRINDQWRICFQWRAGNAHEVEITTIIRRSS